MNLYFTVDRKGIGQFIVNSIGLLQQADRDAADSHSSLQVAAFDILREIHFWPRKVHCHFFID